MVAGAAPRDRGIAGGGGAGGPHRGRGGRRHERSVGALAILATIELGFDPWLRAGDLAVRWEAIALVGVIALALAVFARRLRRSTGGFGPEEFAFVVLAAIPGAVIGGRLVHGLVFLDTYAGQPGALLDLSRGSLSLTGAVLGASLTAGAVCHLLGRPVGRWADAAAIPLLLGIGLGKLAMLLGGAGQGTSFDGSWAVALVGGADWVSADAATPAHPSQVYEGLWCLLGVPLIALIERAAGDGPRSSRGLIYLGALAWWLGGRALVALTWREEPLIGSLGGEQVVTLLVLAGVVVVVGLRLTGRANRPTEA